MQAAWKLEHHSNSKQRKVRREICELVPELEPTIPEAASVFLLLHPPTTRKTGNTRQDKVDLRLVFNNLCDATSTSTYGRYHDHYMSLLMHKATCMAGSLLQQWHLS